VTPVTSGVGALNSDKTLARRAVHEHVRRGLLPHPNTLPCVDCGHVWKEGARRHEYDHFKGYEAAHHLDVEAVCTLCHSARSHGAAIVVSPGEPIAAPTPPHALPSVPVAPLLASKRAMMGSEKSRTTFDLDLRRYCRVLGLDSLDRIDVTKIDMDHLNTVRVLLERQEDPPLRPGTIRQTIGAVRGLVKMAYVRGHVTHAAWLGLSEVKVRGSREAKGHALSREELVALLRVCATHKSPRGEMMRAILLVGIGTGLRVSELCYSPVTKRGLTVDCIHKADGHVRVIGKGNKENVVVLDRVTRHELDAWLTVRRALPWRHVSLFGTPRRGRYLRPDVLWKMLRTLSNMAGVRHFSPHDLRRTFATRMLDQMGLEEVQKLMAHASPATTARYDKRAHAELAAKRRAATVFDPEGG
jgi:integrase/recombinase XerD